MTGVSWRTPREELPMMERQFVGRREFLGRGMALGSGAVPAAMGEGVRADEASDPAREKIRVGLIGCGSVSRVYLPNLSSCPFVELVSTCDKIPDRAEKAAAKFKIANHYPHIDNLLAG